MPINITQSQKINLDNGFIGSAGTFNFKEVTNQINALLIERAEIFKDEWQNQLNSKKIVASGDIQEVDYEVVEDANSVVLNISFPYYAKFVDEGVKGVKSTTNAPKSPYRYRNYGVPQSMKDSLKKYIQSGKAKITSVMNDKALGKGGERKGLRFAGKKTLIDTQVATLGYLIKRFGIKSTNYFTDAFNKTFEDFEVKMFEAVESGIIITFENIKLRDGNK
jgi:uncharacterized protein YlzI (FlbEa/FlbD family)